MKKLRVMVTGGGSGGHIAPIIAVVSELQIEAAKQALNLKIKYLGACGGYRDLLEENNIAVSQIVLSRLSRNFFLKNIIEIPKFLVSFFQALWGVYWFMPDILFSKGGPGSLPVVLSATFYRIPIIVHESDSVPGFSNKVASRFAKKTIISFPSAEKYFSGNAILLGNPIRENLLKNLLTKAEAKRYLGFSAELPLIFVYGGSLGSVRINNLILGGLKEILSLTQVFHQTGKNNYENVLSAAGELLVKIPIGLRDNYKVTDFLVKDEDVKIAYLAADLVVARAGAANIFEIAAFGKPSVLIPLPESAGNHQKNNAYEYATNGAAEILEEKDVFPEIFVSTIKDLLGDSSRLEKMSVAARAFYKPGAAKKIAEVILGLTK